MPIKTINPTKKNSKQNAKEVNIAEVAEQVSKVSNTQPTQLLHTARKNFTLQLDQLVFIDKITDLPGGKEAMRGIKTENLVSLLQADESAIPPIKVQNTNKGFVILDGYHRYSRALTLAEVEFKKQKTGKNVLEDETVDISDMRALRKALDEGINKAERAKFVAQQKIRVECMQFSNILDMVEFTFEANNAHGLTSDKPHRARYGLWLHQNRGLSIHKAAKKAGVSHVAVIHYRDAQVRIKDGDKGQGLAVTGTVAQKTAAQLKAEKEEKSANAMLRNMRAIYEGFKENTPLEFAEWIANFFTVDDAIMVKAFIPAFQKIDEMIEAEVKAAEAVQNEVEEEDEDEDEDEDIEYEDEYQEEEDEDEDEDEGIQE